MTGWTPLPSPPEATGPERGVHLPDPLSPGRLSGPRPRCASLAIILLALISASAWAEDAAPVRMADVHVSIRGNDEIWTWTLRRFLSAYDDEEVSEGLLADIALDLESFYRSDGFPFVSVRIRSRERDGKIRVSIRIQEGPRVEVKEVRFIGLTSVPEAKIRELIASKPSAFLSRSYYEEAKARADARLIADRVRDEGHRNVRVEAETEVIEDRTGAVITFRIEEGIRIGISEIRFEGNQAISTEDLLESIHFEAGEPFSSRRLEEKKWTLEDLYADRGYANRRVRIEPTVLDPDAGEAEVKFNIAEGERSRVVGIRFEGNRITADSLIEARLTFQKGDWYNRAQVLSTTEKLYRLGVFESVRTALEERRIGEVIVVFKLVERKAGMARVGVGYGSFEGVRGIAQVSYGNLFGRAKRIEAETKISGVGALTRFRYVDPSILQGRWKGTAEVFYEDREDPNFDILRRGGSVTFGHPLAEKVTFSIGGRLEASQVSDLATGLVSPDRSLDLRSVIFRFSRSGRDVPVNPSRGTHLRVALESAGGLLGGEGNFEKLTTGGAVYFPVLGEIWPERVVLALSARAGWIFPHDRDEGVPIQEQFFTGGEGTLRGFREKEILPLDSFGIPTGGGGNSVLVLNAEARIRIQGNLWGALFWDLGNVWEGSDEIDVTDLRHSPGVGIRYITPIGPLRLDWAHKLLREEGERPWEIHLSVGFAF